MLQFLLRVRLVSSLVTKTRGTYTICINRSDSFCFTYCMELKNKSKHFSKHASKATPPLKLMCIKSFGGHLKKQMTHPPSYLGFFFHLRTCTRQLDLLLFRHYFFSMSGAARPDQLSAFDEMSASQTNTSQGSGSSN